MEQLLEYIKQYCENNKKAPYVTFSDVLNIIRLYEISQINKELSSMKTLRENK
jgi:hypothetical protein